MLSMFRTLSRCDGLAEVIPMLDGRDGTALTSSHHSWGPKTAHHQPRGR